MKYKDKETQNSNLKDKSKILYVWAWLRTEELDLGIKI
jgi:hypothetical protein